MNPLSAITPEDAEKVPEEMRGLLPEMLNRDFNLRPSCRDLLNNKIIAKTVSFVKTLELNVII